jgi:hypothetical protein
VKKVRKMVEVKAYKITSLNLKQTPSLSIIDDEWFVDTLDTRFLDADGRGLLIIEKKQILKAIKKANKEPIPEDKEMYLNVLQGLLNDCGNEEYCFYSCI